MSAMERLVIVPMAGGALTASGTGGKVFMQFLGPGSRSLADGAGRDFLTDPRLARDAVPAIRQGRSSGI
jgi:hypothetical protein